eukprot:scaffold647944_cov33-Prasinocladus_malaysianus.AAC.1
MGCLRGRRSGCAPWCQRPQPRSGRPPGPRSGSSAPAGRSPGGGLADPGRLAQSQAARSAWARQRAWQGPERRTSPRR